MTATMPIIPRHEPEVVKAKANRLSRGNPEKTPTTSLESLLVAGVLLKSRYGKAQEYELMARMVLDLPAGMAARVKSVFCDSKAGVHSVSLPEWDLDTAYAIGLSMEETCMTVSDGHSGIWVCHTEELIGGYGVESIEMAAVWVGDLEG